MAPVLLGSEARTLFELPALKSMQDKIALNMLDVRKFGEDMRFVFGKRV
jgi:riboflavin biosynthesis pyrimidine reductase